MSTSRKPPTENADKPQHLLEEEVAEEDLGTVSYKGDSAWSKIHTSHKRNMVGGVVYCRRCGYFRINKAVGLAKPCRGKPMYSAEAILRKLNNGQHPVPGAPEWPDGTSAKSRLRPTAIDRY